MTLQGLDAGSYPEHMGVNPIQSEGATELQFSQQNAIVPCHKASRDVLCSEVMCRCSLCSDVFCSEVLSTKLSCCALMCHSEVLCRR